MQNNPLEQAPQVPPDSPLLPQAPDLAPNPAPTPTSIPKQSYRQLIIGVVVGVLVGVFLTVVGFVVYNALLSGNSNGNKNSGGIVSESDIKKYTDSVAKDCTKENAQFSHLELVATKYAMKSVDLDKQKITMTREIHDGSSEDFSIQWKTMPTIVDGNCDKITFADIQQGAFLNLYVSKANRYLDSGTELIQRTPNWRD